jgi:Ca2+-binding RTX toxin-like protein
MSDSKFSVEVRVDSGRTNVIPHAFIVLTDEFRNQQGYGFAPSKNLDLWGPGIILDNTNHPYDNHWSYDLSQEQYDDLTSYIFQQQQNPGIYEGWDRNCVSFVSNALRYAGIDDLQSAPFTHPVELWWRQNFISHYSNGATNLSGDYDQLGNFITSLQTQFQVAKTTISPLILDLDGDGIETISKSAGIYFDHDGNQFSETTGWVGKDDGLLVWDKNGNGRIDDGSELFGNNTLLNNSSKAANGFAALADLDVNHDNKIDTLDSAFSQLRLWRDADSNALLSAGELVSLDASGVQSFNLSYRSQDLTDAQGNEHRQIGSYTRIDGSSRAMDDVWFAADTARTIDRNLIEIDDEIAALPDLQGFGNAHSLHQAMARDQSGELKGLVQEFVSQNKPENRAALMQNIIFLWSGSSGYGATSRGGYVGDARKLYALEAFLGERFFQGFGENVGTNNPGPEATNALMKGFESLSQMLTGQLMLQTQYKNLIDSIGLTWEPSNATFKLDVSAIVTAFQTTYEKDSANGLYLINDFGIALTFLGDFGSNVLGEIRQKGDIRGSEFSRSLAIIAWNFISGNDDSDVVSGDLKKENTLFGLGGADVIHGGAEDDVLCGGRGDDFLSGAQGNDVYLFSNGDGNDRINEYEFASGTRNFVKFTDVTSTDLNAVERRLDDLVLSYGTTNQLAVSNYFNGFSHTIEQFGFADGVNWNDAAIKARVMTPGSAGADYIVGYDDGTNRITGLDGKDKLFGGSMDDQIDGGSGDDSLSGNAGNDSLTGGTGNDRIDAGSGNDILLGGDGNDSLYGGDGDDVFESGSGNDVMDGGSGNDIYRLRSDGNDRIVDSGGGVDIAQLTDLAAADIQVLQRLQNDLIFNYGTNNELTVSNYFKSTSFRIEQFSFADGVSWDGAAIKDRILVTTAAADYITGYEDESNLIFGLDGSDSLYGGNKDDQIDGGMGNDNIVGGVGNDILLGGDGNDALYGGQGDDLLDPGTGIDVLVGGSGNDVYRLRSGGNSRIVDSEGSADVVQLADVASTDVLSVQRMRGDLIVNYGAVDQLTVSDYFSSFYAPIEQFRFADGVSWDDAAIKARVMTMGAAGADYITGYTDGGNRIFGFDGHDKLYGGNKDDQIDGDNGNDYLSGYAGNDSLVGGTGNDNMYGGEGNDVLLGGDGDDTLYGDDGDDLLDSGTGNDVMVGGGGNDIYRLRSSGNGRIVDSDGGADVVQFADVTSIDIQSVQRLGGDLIFSYGTSGQLTVSDYFSSPDSRIEQFSFADGMSWDDASIKAWVLVSTAGSDYITGYDDESNRIFGFDGDDSLYGGSKDDQIGGGDGDDLLVGDGGDDLLDSGSGSDVMDGGSGNDHYILRRGGNDRIVDSGGGLDIVQLTDVASTDFNAVERRVDDLVLSYGMADQLTVSNYFKSTPNRIEQFNFSDGVSWDDAVIKGRVMTVGSAGADYITGYTDGRNCMVGLDGNDNLRGGSKEDHIDGGNGNDYIAGSDGDDSLVGGNGDDTLVGDMGNDTYLFARGNGADRLIDFDQTAGNQDKLWFTDMASDDVRSLQKLNNDLVICFDKQDQLTVVNYFSNKNFSIEQFIFSDGKIWDETAIKERVMTIGSAESDVMFGYLDGSNHIVGKEGNDLLTGGNGNDVIDGGEGSDFIYGGAGDDEIQTGQGFDIVAFNKGHGHDTILASSGQDNTISLGAGTSVADLTLSKLGNDLVLGTSKEDSVTLRGWYEDDSFHSVKTLQFVTPAATGIKFQSSGPIEQYDFSEMVNYYDQMHVETGMADAWSMIAALKNNRLGTNSWSGIGGYVANEFGSNKNPADMSFYTLQNKLTGSQFGQSSEGVISFAAPPRAWV